MAKPRWIFLVIGPHGVCGWTHATLTSTGLEWQELFKKKMQWLEPWSPYLKRGKVVWRRMQLYGSIMLISEVSLMLGGWPAPAPSYPPPLLLVPLLSGSSQDTKAHSDFFSAFFFFSPFYPGYICSLFSELAPALLTFWTLGFIRRGNFKNCAGLCFGTFLLRELLIRAENQSAFGRSLTFPNRTGSHKIGFFPFRRSLEKQNPARTSPPTLSLLASAVEKCSLSVYSVGIFAHVSGVFGCWKVLENLGKWKL